MDRPVERGALITVAAPGAYGKVRPALVVQSAFFKEHPSVTVCLITSDLRDAPLFRLTLHPSAANGLEKPLQIMVDKLVTVSREEIRDIIGHLEDKSMAQVNRALAMWVGLG